MKPLIIYHADCADGFGAAFAAWLKFGDNAEYKPMKYGDETAQWDALRDHIYEGRDVYILDFSLPRSLMDDLFDVAARVTWLDHHKTAFEMWCGSMPADRCYIEGDPQSQRWIELDDLRSGALIAWNYFHPDKPVPLAIQHIDDYDRWQFKLGGTKEFVKALWSYAPWSFGMWGYMNDCGAFGPVLGTPYNEMLTEGAALLRAHNQNVQSLVPDAIVCEMQLRPEVSARGFAVNGPYHLASDLGHELANRSSTYGLVWQMTKNGRVKCSLRSNGDYDVSAIAKEFGGGGHRNAAGFEVSIEALHSWLQP